MIIDTHTHFYDPTRPQGVPWPEPDDEILYRRVLPSDYKALAVPEGVTGTIVVEASPWVEDNQWILDLADQDPFIVGFVGHLDPCADEFDQLLERFAAHPVFRGIRPGGKGLKELEQSGFLAAMEQLVARDLELDAGLNPGLEALACRLPELRIVINHIGGIPIDGEKPDPARLELMHRLAEHPQVYCKVSGLMDLRSQVQPAPTDLAFYTPVLDALWEIFGEDRLLYGSDWPVSDRSSRSNAQVQQLVAEYFSTKGQEALDKYFWQNSKKAYKWIDRGEGPDA
jgi:L-fuconolactonase